MIVSLLKVEFYKKKWLKRQIPLLRRVAILNSSVLSKLWSLLPNLSDHIIMTYRKLSFALFGIEKNNNINRKRSIKNMNAGGIPDARTYMNALKLSWQRKINKTNHSWKQISCPQRKQYILQTNWPVVCPFRSANSFYMY